MLDSRGRAAGARPRRRARPAAQGRRAGPRTGVAAVGRIAALIKAAQPQISNRQIAKAIGVAGKIRHVNEEPKPESSPEAP